MQDGADIQSMDSCEFIWEAGVGFAQTPPLNHTYDSNRSGHTPHPACIYLNTVQTIILSLPF